MECRLPEDSNERQENLDIEQSNGIVMTRDLFKKTGVAMVTFHAVMDAKDRKGKDLAEAGEIKTRRQKYTEELHKKGLNDPDRHDAGVTHVKQDILEYEIKWSLGSITQNKLAEVMEFQLSC